MNFRKAFFIVVSTTLVFAILGGFFGFCLGRFLPDYYRSVFRNGSAPDFNPVEVGLRLGITQGITVGAILGIVVLVAMVRRDLRIRKGSENAKVRKGMNAGTRQLLRIAGIVVSALVIPLILFFGLWMASSFGSDRGSLALATEWRKQLGEYSDPKAAVVFNQKVWVIHCENGEWMFGLAQGSHGIWKRGGGTVVTKDSNGDIRSYHGHVCWPNGSPFRGGSTENLAAVYASIIDLGFEALGSGAAIESNGPKPANHSTTTPLPAP